MSALAALTLRTLSGSRRDADLLFAALAPVGCFLGFTLVLGSLIHPGSMTYPQYVLPVVIVQAMLFGAMTTADRAARDRLSGFGSRLKTLPVPAAVPLAARMLYCLIRSVVALVAAVAVGWSFGFRMAGGPGDTGLFVIIVVAFAMAVCLGADALGSRVGSVESSSQLLLLPQLVLVLLSTGIAPAESFPAWLGPFVRHQPVSRVTDTLRGLAAGHATGRDLAVASAWCLGLLALFGVLAVRMQRRVGGGRPRAPRTVRIPSQGARQARDASAQPSRGAVATHATRRVSYAPSLTAFLSHSASEAGRLLRRWRRDPIVAVQALLFPAFLLIVYKLLIGKAVLAVTGHDSLYGLVPMCAVVGAVFGTLGAGLALPAERESGVLTRLWVQPVHRASTVAGRLVAEAARTTASAVVLTIFGVALGLRFSYGWIAALAFVLVPVAISAGMATLVIAIAARADGKAMVTWLGAGCVLLLFLNTGVAPAGVFPGWLQPVVRFSPISPTIEAMRALAEGGPVLSPLWQAALWAGVLVAAFAPVAVRGYRAAAEAGC
ncbi:ABC transporter permease [Mycobacterium intracellulare]|uniref:Transport permease protein n=1 Tax=Mycobacterium intracellulare subsp. chimaera TaxID=222805 RepID=A0A7U5MJH2_MYCIT|nr:ABC transporter permease [Mycobacterium intracellulare]AOS91726.1 ABC transporter [Mycobacterium intracellulare subsp. chimaera]ASL14601.1 ABC transporter [Mycobacterium intracellulare subsp. chimaera]ASQ85840.1 ABC transporter [Mycobacterium intracellulare subsp. chimaera]MCA2309532.1 ABC transporter permease [Mycobacterium intracellulare subsp. chimaera]MCA2352649.1 ABC transporter permease [Mycobacterium intracellulare subsp. chimaera]